MFHCETQPQMTSHSPPHPSNPIYPSTSRRLLSPYIFDLITMQSTPHPTLLQPHQQHQTLAVLYPVAWEAAVGPHLSCKKTLMLRAQLLLGLPTWTSHPPPSLAKINKPLIQPWQMPSCSMTEIWCTPKHYCRLWKTTWMVTCGPPPT